MKELNVDYKIKNKPKSVVQFDVVVPWKEIEGKLDSIFKDIRKEVRLDGFRKGKAPMDIIEEKYTREARAELVRINVPEILTDIFEKEEINPVTTPQIESYDFKDGKQLSLSVKTEVAPEFKLKKYTKLKVYKTESNFTDKDIKETIESLRNKNASLEVKDGIAKDGDFALTRMQVFMDSSEVKLGFPRERLIEIGEDGFLPGMGDKIKGMKKGDTKEFSYKFPDDYYKDELKGKDADFKIEVKEVKVKSLPKVEDIAKSMGIESVDKLKEDIRKNIESQHKNRQTEEVENQIIDELIERHEFEVPEGLVDEKFKAKKKQMDTYIKNQGGDPSMVENDKLSDQARKDVKAGMILSKIADEEDIKVTDKDRKKEEDSLAKMYNIKDREKIKKYVNDNKILTDKIFNFLKDGAKIKTKKAEKK
ncbi:MAG: trigger factor [Elusimicrobia bacterium]|jgi:trigger factor|nr:trigger factor [Elusimicrobiota bacterium]